MMTSRSEPRLFEPAPEQMPGQTYMDTDEGDAMNDVDAILAAARARAPEPKRIDYAGVNRVFPKQKAALTRAVKSGDPDRVVLACRDAVRAWGEAPFNGAWPDDWSRWQRALDDALGYGRSVNLSDL